MAIRNVRSAFTATEGFCCLQGTQAIYPKEHILEQPTRKKPIFYAEAAYLLGLLALALGVAAMEAADFGVSMVVAPAYLIYRKLSLTLPFFTFGMAEYCLQAVLLAVTMLLLRRFRLSWFLTFATAVFYGFLLDGCMALIAPIPHNTLVLRLAFYVVGVLLCSVGVSLVFHTYLPPEAYELFVKLVSQKFGVNINVFKTGYDIISMLVGVALSFCFFGFGTFVGVKLGTLACALINGFLIGRFSKLFERFFMFRDALPWRRFFE